MCWPIIVTPESRSMQKASKSGREKVGLAMSRSFFRCVVSALPSSKDLDTFYAFNTPRSQNRSTPKIPKSRITSSALPRLHRTIPGAHSDWPGARRRDVLRLYSPERADAYQTPGTNDRRSQLCQIGRAHV